MCIFSQKFALLTGIYFFFPNWKANWKLVNVFITRKFRCMFDLSNDRNYDILFDVPNLKHDLTHG